MDLEDGMVDHLEEHVEPLVTRRRSRRVVGPRRFPSFATLFSRQDVGINLEYFVSIRTLGDHSTLPQQFLPHQFVPPYGGDDSGVNITIDPIDQIQPEADSSRGKAKVSLTEIVEEDETAVEYESENKSKAGPSKESRFSPHTSPMGEGAKEKYRDIYRPLYQAALEGNWRVAEGVIGKCRGAVHSRITVGQETPLHIAAAMKHESFLKELLLLMKPEHLEIKNNEENTAFCFAAASGNVKIAKLMVARNENLPNIRGAKNVTPLYMAALFGHRDMAWYLLDVTDLNSLEDDDYIGLLFASIDSKLYDLALKIVKFHDKMARATNEKGETALHVLARKPSELGKSQQVFWRRCIDFYLYRLRGTESEYNSMHKKARELLLLLWTKVQDYYDPIFPNLMADELISLLFLATEIGNVEFVTVLIQSYPDLVYMVDNKNGRTIFHVAVACRQKEIFNLIYRIGAIKDQIAYCKDKDKNNLLHLAGMLAPEDHLSKISGAALQMQEELIWFKEVEHIVIPSYREMENGHCKSPRVLFTKEHLSLKTKGEEWMKATANSCMLAATLIATVMFTAAFTVPGGNKDDNGSPNFLRRGSFMVFAISDAVSLFSSATSILMFLSILTSHYAEEDFFTSLPIRLILGLAALFISIATMMVAFSATFFIIFHDGFSWVSIPVTLLASIPIGMFAKLQFPLFWNMIRSTRKAIFLFSSNHHRVRKHAWTSTSLPL